MRLFFFTFFVILINGVIVFSQVESIGPLTENQFLKSKEVFQQKSLISTFDSSFLYLPDTIDLPLFDEFSTNKFQTYTQDFSDPNVTFVKEYKVLDAFSLLPINNLARYTILPTFRRTYNVAANTHADVALPSITLKVGNQSNYPTVYSTTTAFPPYYIYDTLDFPNPSDTVWISDPDIYQDSSTQFFLPINNPNLIWLDNNVYQNYTYAVQPWTLGVVTFDGLKNDGNAYTLGAVNPSFADFLTSKPIDLSSYTASDSIYLSFLYQGEGFGDIPETSDSLVLEFYADDLNQWFWAWSTSGIGASTFKVGNVSVLDAKFFKKGFQFRFKNYGSLAGNFDNFHLDYVHLRSVSNGFSDTLFEDFAFVYPIKSLLKNYTSVPWDHYKNNSSGKMSDNVKLSIRNGSNTAENNSTPGKVEVFYNGVLESTFNVTGSSLSNNDLNYSPRTFYDSYHDFSSGYHFDETKTGDDQHFKVKGSIQAIFPNLGTNDTTVTDQFFSNYYSYDDGSAEAAYGPTGAQARLAVRFDSYEPDSLIGIMTNFVKSATDVSNQLFLLTVWADGNGKPGSVIYQDTIFSPRTPIYKYGLNNFHSYYFLDTLKVPVGTTFYVGWRQFDALRLDIGFDRNVDSKSKTYYSTTNELTWNQSQISGTAMIRPIFSTALDAQLGVEKISKGINELIIYPNPSTGHFTVKHLDENYLGVEIYSLQGQLINDTNSDKIDISEKPSGVYFVKQKGNFPKVYKIIKE